MEWLEEWITRGRRAYWIFHEVYDAKSETNTASSYKKAGKKDFLQSIEKVMEDIGRRDELWIGVYSLDDLVDAAYRETTKIFMDWVQEFKESEYRVPSYISEDDYKEWSRL